MCLFHLNLLQPIKIIVVINVCIWNCMKHPMTLRSIFLYNEKIILYIEGLHQPKGCLIDFKKPFFLGTSSFKIRFWSLNIGTYCSKTLSIYTLNLTWMCSTSSHVELDKKLCDLLMTMKVVRELISAHITQLITRDVIYVHALKLFRKFKVAIGWTWKFLEIKFNWNYKKHVITTCHKLLPNWQLDFRKVMT
jgi:hypothetical protein